MQPGADSFDPKRVCLGPIRAAVDNPCCRCGGEAIDSGHEVCSRCLDEVEGFHGHDPY